MKSKKKWSKWVTFEYEQPPKSLAFAAGPVETFFTMALADKIKEAIKNGRKIQIRIWK